MTGRKFGKLTALHPNGRNKHNHLLWKCRCECGNEKNILSFSLTGGGTKSCGCWQRESMQISPRNYKHGHSYHENRSHLYGVWAAMLSRTSATSPTSGKNYYDRGIRHCEEWEDFMIFKDWAESNGYEEHLTIDRIDNDGDYEPDNCRWTTKQMQARNRRTNRWITVGDETKVLAEWCEIYNIAHNTVLNRINDLGWSEEDAVTTPLKRIVKRKEKTSERN